MAGLTVMERRPNNEGVAKRGRPPGKVDSTVAKGKPKDAEDKPKDRHVSGFMVRLPDEYREIIRKADDPDLTYTVKIRRAVDAWLRTKGIEPPKTN
jgi:hypothetical protein